MKILKTTEFYTKQLLRSHPDKLFLFGDNTHRVGKGGQAAIRDEENACGIVTKVSPSLSPDAFFCDETLHLFVSDVFADLEDIRETAEGPVHFTAIVVPFTEDGQISLGMGLAELPKRSPITYNLISGYLHSLAREYGGWAEL
jgi:hypothetical protein